MDQILLYRGDNLTSDTSINISSLSINNKIYPLCTLCRINNNFNFYTPGAQYNLEFPIVERNDIGITLSNNNSVFKMVDSGVYYVQFILSCDSNSDSSISVQIKLNGNQKTNTIIKLGENKLNVAWMLDMVVNDEITVEINQISTVLSNLNSLNNGSYIIINKYR